jgi:DNA-binding transcriptional regulator GbsR (MarR family)
MKPEELFGVNAGKVWSVLNSSQKPLSATEIMKKSGLKRDDVFAALGWLGREGKIEIIKEKGKLLYKLV